MKHFLGINWLVRIKNPVFWAQVVVALFVPMLTQMGLVWDQITTWRALWQVVVQGLSNPVTVVAMLLSVWNTVNDPTTAGLRDS
ncbi:MAG: phage holin, partial [Clostridia bacterium]|nr:phage holin [Clostridia bacterium]